MSFYSKPIACITILVVSGFVLPPANAAEVKVSESTTKMSTVFTPDEIQWMPGSNLLPEGSKVAILEGDPSKDGPFTMRIKFPANYKNAPHTHPKVEHMTVISGTFHLGIGQKFDSTNGKALPAGSFMVIPADVPHYGWGTEETVLQIHGMGPREKVSVNPTTTANPASVKSAH